MKITVFGANGPTGRLLTRLALDEHHDIVAFTRHPDGFPIEHPRLGSQGPPGDRLAAAGPSRTISGRHPELLAAAGGGGKGPDRGSPGVAQDADPAVVFIRRIGILRYDRTQQVFEAH